MNRTVTMQQPKRAAALNIRTITMTALLSAMAYVLAFVEFPVPLSPSFARMDLSDFPALIGAFAFGPISGLLIELVKNALQLMTTSTGGIGEIANFLMGASYVVAAGVIYKRRKTKKTALLACVAASFVMGIAAALANYFILLPLFETFIPLDQLIAHDALPKDSKVLAISKDGNALSLDMDEAFLAGLRQSGSTGESMYLGSLVNTFLDNFNCETVRVTVEGKTFSTAHADYDKPLQAFTF